MTTTKPEPIRVTDTATRATIEAAIVVLMAKKRRMPEHWVDRRAEVGDEIDVLVDAWLLAPAVL
jgi:hypothetical protein